MAHYNNNLIYTANIVRLSDFEKYSKRVTDYLKT